MKSIYTLFILLLFCFTASAQTAITTQPRVSQAAMTGQTIGIADIYVKYHRPAVKEREIWGKLVPFGQVWRAGANENTIIKFTKEVSIGDQKLAAGKYGLHVLLNEGQSEVIFSHDHSAWGSFAYDPQKDVLRTPTQLVSSGRNQEFLSYEFENITANSADCAIYWGDKKMSFTISADVHEQVIANLSEELKLQAGWTWMGWNEAANYCLRNEVDLKQGMQWASRSVFMSPNTINMLTQSRLSAKLAPEGTDENEALVAAMEKNLNSFQVSWKEWDGMAQYLLNNDLDLDKALSWSGKSVSMSPTMTNMMTKSAIFAKMDNATEAEMVKKEAIKKGSNAELNTYGYQLLFGGKVNEAVAVFEANADKNPDDPNVFDSLGEGYLNAGQNEKAIKAFKKCLSMNPPANVRANSIKLLHQLGVDTKSLKP